ncbi:MAG: HD domain-containing protein [Desulfobulbaceae bacterium]|nr:HD domain-containing protein [Desulfobulbaceae bacterium]
MHLEKKYPHNSLTVRDITNAIPVTVLDLLSRIAADSQESFHITGGTVRDILMGRRVHDLDITVQKHSKAWAQSLARLANAPHIPLGREDEAQRVIINNFQIDISHLREQSTTIEQDLTLRDLTINSLAFFIDKDFHSNQNADNQLPIIDPLNGLDDLARRTIRHNSSHCLTDDPLRMLRVFRFAAVLNFSIDETTVNLVSSSRRLINNTAGERINYELEEIMKSDRAAQTFSHMAKCGLLKEIIPQLMVGEEMTQPSSHHLDVLGHSMAALESMEKISTTPESFFAPSNLTPLHKYLNTPKRRTQLKWAALLHDIGKTTTRKLKDDTRITFYNHDLKGSELTETIAKRLHWSNDTTRRITLLIRTHMRPFHLCNVARESKLSLRACIRLIKAIGKEYPGLFLLAMADSTACKGKECPEMMNEEINALFTRVIEVYKNNIQPIDSQPPILTGKDLIETLQLQPGPIFSKLLELVRLSHMEDTTMTREEAFILVRNELELINKREC